jgi:hypothetical protein
MTKPYVNQPNGKPIYQQFISPIGRIVHCYHDKPQLDTTDTQPPRPILDEDGIQKATFKVTLMWPKSMLDRDLIPLRTLAATVRDEAWPGSAGDNWFRLETFLRDGDSPEHNTKKKEYLFGHVYLNFKQKAQATRGSDGRVSYSGAPQCIGPYNEDLLPSDVYAGCMARVSGIMFGTEYSGKNFISTRLNNIQKAADGERIGGGGRPDAKSQFDPLATGPAPGAGGLRSIVL